MVRRTAFTMIELIFAIVVISIAVISLPMMTQINAQGVSENVKQEAIFIASAKLMQVLSYPWDKRAVDINNSFDSARVVDLNISGSIYGRKDLNNNDDNGSIFRIGHVRDDLHRRFFNFADSPTPGVGIEDQVNPPDITGNRKIGYKGIYATDINVIYVSDTSNTLSITPVATSNLKLVQIDINNTLEAIGKQHIVTLRSYVANIGEVDYFSRIY